MAIRNPCGRALTDMIQTLDLEDTWRVRNQDAKRFTHRQKTKAGIVHYRLDYIFTSINLAFSICEKVIESGIIQSFQFTFNPVPPC